MMLRKIKNTRLFNVLFFLQILSVYFSRFHHTYIFSIKPYMIIVSLLFILYFKFIRFDRLYNYELFFLMFMYYYTFTALNFNYPEKHIRFMIANIVIVFYYLVLRGLIKNIPYRKLKDYYFYSGFIAVALSLIYYYVGLKDLNWFFNRNNILTNGVLLDRSIPRMVGVVSHDPNIFVFYISGFLFYNLQRFSEGKKYKVGTFLSILSVMLSFSRGAIVSIFVTLFYYFIRESDRTNLMKTTINIILFSFIFIKFLSYLQINIFDLFIKRVLSINTDGGSGRVQLWRNSLQTFKDNPIFGIGLNATVNYNKWNYNDNHYVHNTFLEVLSETGIIGGIIYAVFWISLLISAWKNKNKLVDSKFIYYTLISMLIQLNFLSILHNEAFYLMVVIHYYYVSQQKKEGINHA